MRRENIPPSHGVSSGPKMVAFQTKRLSSECGLALHPSGGLCLIDLRSLISRSCAALCEEAAMAVFLRRVCSACPPFVPRPPCLAMPQGCCRLRCSANEPRLRAPDGEVCASPAGCVCASVCSFGPGGHCATRRVELAWQYLPSYGPFTLGVTAQNSAGSGCRLHDCTDGCGTE